MLPGRYPSLTNKIFEGEPFTSGIVIHPSRITSGPLLLAGFICRNLGPSDSVLEVDYAISCTDAAVYTPVLILCSVLVIVWPFGLPAFMFKLM